MRNIGLKDVKKEEFPAHAYSFGGASVQITSPTQGEVWTAAGHAGLPGTSPGGITADIVYVGSGPSTTMRARTSLASSCLLM